MYDVIAVNMENHKVRLIAEDKTLKNAEAIEHMTVLRRGVDEEFFMTVDSGRYSEGDEWDMED